MTLFQLQGLCIMMKRKNNISRFVGEIGWRSLFGFSCLKLGASGGLLRTSK